MTATPLNQTRLQQAAFAMVLLNCFTTPLMLSAANVALPAIARDLRLHAVMLSWIPMAYLMASAMFVLIFGRLADMYGRKRIFLYGTGGVVVTSLMAALAVNGEFLIGARFLQGVCAAMLYATQMAIVSSVFPPARRGHAIGLAVSTIYLGLACGPLIGGYLIDLAGWRISFMFYIPLAVIVILIGLYYVPGEWSAEERGEFDIAGAIVYMFAIVALCLGVSTLPHIASYALIAAGFFGLYFFIRMSSTSPHPVLDVKLFLSNRVFTLSCLAALIIYTATFANIVLVSLYLQYLKGMGAGAAGLIMMIQPLTMAAFSPFAGRLSDRVEPRIIASAGMAVTAAGLALLAMLDGVASLHYLIGALVTTGIGFSMFSSPNANAIMGAVEKRYYGSASGSLATMRVLGQLNSMVLVTLIFALVIGQVEIQPENYPDLQHAIRLCFTVATGLCIAGIAFSLARGRMHKGRTNVIN